MHEIILTRNSFDHVFRQHFNAPDDDQAKDDDEKNSEQQNRPGPSDIQLAIEQQMESDDDDYQPDVSPPVNSETYPRDTPDGANSDLPDSDQRGREVDDDGDGEDFRRRYRKERLSNKMNQ